MKTKPDYPQNILTSDLLKLPNGTLFSEHTIGYDPPSEIYKKIGVTVDGKDIIIEPMYCTFYRGASEASRLGYTNESDKEWFVWSEKEILRIVGWLMSSTQVIEE